MSVGIAMFYSGTVKTSSRKYMAFLPMMVVSLVGFEVSSDFANRGLASRFKADCSWSGMFGVMLQLLATTDPQRALAAGSPCVVSCYAQCHGRHKTNGCRLHAGHRHAPMNAVCRLTHLLCRKSSMSSLRECWFLLRESHSVLKRYPGMPR